MYGLLIFFQLGTHTHLFEEEEEDYSNPTTKGLYRP